MKNGFLLIVIVPLTTFHHMEKNGVGFQQNIVDAANDVIKAKNHGLRKESLMQTGCV